MSLFHTLAGTTLVLIGLAHSLLGERVLIRPLLADDRWAAGIPRPAAEQVLRFAWHVTTIAWLGLGATAFGLDGTVALTATALVTGVFVLLVMRTHLSWPLFLLAALWGGVATDVVTSTWLVAGGLAAAAIATVAAAVHVAWAAGRAPRSAASAVPTTDDGVRLFAPSPLATLVVAAALATFAGALTLLVLQPTYLAARVVVAGATVVLAVRAIGDGRYVGFSKRVRSTSFGRRDDAVFTPIVAALTIGGAAALAL